jgi:hypothetical protein
MKDSTATYEMAHVLFIRHDVAAVKVRQRPVTLDGRLMTAHHTEVPSALERGSLSENGRDGRVPR